MEKDKKKKKKKKKAPLSAKTALSATMAATLALTMAPVPQHRAFAEEWGVESAASKDANLLQAGSVF